MRGVCLSRIGDATVKDDIGFILLSETEVVGNNTNRRARRSEEFRGFGTLNMCHFDNVQMLRQYRSSL